VPWVFLRLEQGILGAGVKRTSDVPGRSRFAAGAFFAIARHYGYFLAEWVQYEGFRDAVATSPTLLSVSIIDSQIIAPGMEIEINGNIYSVVASSAGQVEINPALPFGLTSIKYRQLSMRIDRKWRYL
jgi:hypothetical protein